MSFFNVFFCCCFNPLPIYIFNRGEALKKSFSYSTINWVLEGNLTKEQFLYTKHKVSYLRLWLNRIAVFILVFFVFYLFPELIFFFFSIFSNLCCNSTIYYNDKTSHLFLVSDLILTLVLVLSIIIYTKLSHTPRFFCCVISFIFGIILVIFVFIFYLKNRENISFSTSSTKV